MSAGAAPKRRIGAARRRRLRRALISTVLGTIALLSALPLYFVVITAFKNDAQFARSLFAPPSSLNLHNFRTAWESASIGT
ncbi:MAG: hypothetical protein QOF27_1095, partial [Gaiellaceae bacterium]|nr:hypothetical protein [Gaiellaceae bacterium]